MEIERKFLITQLPAELKQYEAKHIEQAYLCTEPVVRVRRSNDRYMLTCKGAGLLSREEFELPLTEQAYRHLCAKADGRVICKVRYLIPYQDRLIELDEFQGGLAPLVVAEVEFESEAQARSFVPPEWFGREVTYDPSYSNAALSRQK